MDQRRDLADSRLLSGCVYCGALEETRDHVPSRVFLDPPFPTNLPVVPACRACNNGFARDEEYVACVIECTIAGSVDPEAIRRAPVAQILRRSPALRSRLEAGKSIAEGQVAFAVEVQRLESVLRKLAIGHAAFELSFPARRSPASLAWKALPMMSAEERDSFDAAHVTELFGEVGSRGMQRQMITQLSLQSESGEKSTVGLVVNDWIDVQDDRYRYLAIESVGGVTIRIVIGEFLAAEVRWTDEGAG